MLFKVFISLSLIQYTISQVCLPQCDTCADETSCLTCKDLTTNINFNCLCPQKRYFDMNGICQSCLSQCNSCDNGYSCTSCKDGYELYKNKCVCKEGYIQYKGECHQNCQEGDYMDFETLQCLKCKFYENSCVQECPNNSVLNPSTNECEIEDSLKINLVLIVTGVGVLLIGIGLVCNCYSKGLNYEQFKSEDQTNKKYIDVEQDSERVFKAKNVKSMIPGPIESTEEFKKQQKKGKKVVNNWLQNLKKSQYEHKNHIQREEQQNADTYQENNTQKQQSLQQIIRQQMQQGLNNDNNDIQQQQQMQDPNSDYKGNYKSFKRKSTLGKARKKSFKYAKQNQ